MHDDVFSKIFIISCFGDAVMSNDKSEPASAKNQNSHFLVSQMHPPNEKGAFPRLQRCASGIASPLLGITPTMLQYRQPEQLKAQAVAGAKVVAHISNLTSKTVFTSCAMEMSVHHITGTILFKQ